MVPKYPKVVWVVPTSRCNTKCRTCPHFYCDFGQDMSPELFARIDAQLLDHVERVHLVGGGEPLVSRIFPDMLEACARRRIKIFLITNTIALKEELVRTLVRSDAEVMVSVDGASHETFNYVRPYVGFDRLLDRVRMIQTVRREHPASRFQLMFNMVVMRHNMHEMAAMAEMAVRYGVDNMLFSDFIPHNMGPNLDAQTPCLYPDQLRGYADEAVRVAQSAALRYEMPGYYTARPTSDDVQAPQAGPAATRSRIGRRFIFPRHCTLPWTHANILVDGNVTTCCNAQESLGNLNEQSFDEIWGGAQYNTVRRLIRTNNPPGSCARCNLIAGIGAGNPNYHGEFLHNNHLRSLDGCQMDGRDLTFGQDVWLERESVIAFEPGEAAFAVLHLDPGLPVSGMVGIGSHEVEFGSDNPVVVLRMPERRGDGAVSAAFRSLGRTRLLGIDLLGDAFMAENEEESHDRRVLDDFGQGIEELGQGLEQAAAEVLPARTFLVFGANAVGRRLAERGRGLGLSFVGFLDNNVREYDCAPTFAPSDLATLRPDIVVVASRRHAGPLAEQARAHGGPQTRIVSLAGEGSVGES